MTLRPLRTIVAIAMTIMLGSTALADNLSDAEIIGIYSQVNSFDIETALLGELKGKSTEVKALGKMVSNDHSGVRAAIHKMAKELGIEPVLPPSRINAAINHDEAVDRMRSADGEKFDTLYLNHEIAFHRAAIDAVKTLLIPETEAPELKAHFEAVLPAFEHHLKANIEAAEKLGITISE